MHRARCLGQPTARHHLPLAFRTIKAFRSPSDARCSLAAVAAERPVASDRSSSGGSTEHPAFFSRARELHAQSNGSDDHRSYNGQQTAQGTTGRPVGSAADELNGLRQELSSVRELVSAQAELFRQQSLAISQLKSMLQVQTQQVVKAAQPRTELRPLDAQLAALGDRRYMGMYDARFHSTHK